jgi:hypothetical protein
MASSEQKKKLLKVKIAVALHDELGRVPKEEEINQVFLLAWVMIFAGWLLCCECRGGVSDYGLAPVRVQVWDR